MAQMLSIKLSDEVYDAIKRQAQAIGASPAALAARWLQQKCVMPEPSHGEPPGHVQAARERFESHFGEVNLGHPTGADNDSIDADLAMEYASNHGGD